MIPRLILVIVVAIVFYYALPLSFKKLTMRRRAKDVGRLLSLTDSKPVKGTLVSLNENIMTAAPAGSGEEIRVVPNRTRFYLREENGVIEQLNWDSVFLAQKGLSILWLPAKKPLRQESVPDFDARRGERKTGGRRYSCGDEGRRDGEEMVRSGGRLPGIPVSRRSIALLSL